MAYEIQNLLCFPVSFSSFYFLLDLPSLSYFSLDCACLYKTEHFTLSNVPFTNGEHIQHNVKGSYVILENLSYKGVIYDESIIIVILLLVVSTRLRNCILNGGKEN